MIQIEGAMTAIVTPLKDGKPDFAALETLIEEQIAAGITGIVAVGTTGESATLTPEEHLAVVQQTVDIVSGRSLVIAGAGANATREAISMSQSCQKRGADALLHVTPYYNKPTQEGLVQHFKAITDASDLPIILYNVPGRTACSLAPTTIAKLAKHPRIVALKDASADMRAASEILSLCDHNFSLLSGDDFTALPLLALGGKGVISVVSNIMPSRVAAMCKAASQGHWDRAKKEHFALLPLSDILFRESNPIPVKAALHMMGKIESDIRLPLTQASPATCDALRSQLQKDGLL